MPNTTQRKKNLGGRPPNLMTCPTCGKQMGQQAMRLHEAQCRRRHLLKPGAEFTLAEGEKVIPVAIVKRRRDGSLTVRNREDGTMIEVKSPRRFKEWMERANIRFRGKRGEQRIEVVNG